MGIIIPLHSEVGQCYTLDSANSTYAKSYKQKGQHVFNVEQGERFYLQLHVSTPPIPVRAVLYKNGEIVESTRDGTIYVGIDRMGIQTVDRQAYAGNYTIEGYTDSGAVYGEFSFKLVVKGMYHTLH